MNYKISFGNARLNGVIQLPHSKSISNRLLVLKALAAGETEITNLSESDDTLYMSRAFREEAEEINIGHAGTAMRFLTAYFAAVGKPKIITGSDRMQNRPIGVLVDALNSLGADISYMNKSGFPPVRTSGKPLTGNVIELQGSISSQYITALLMIAPVLPEGLTIHITDTLISSSYVKLTLGMMNDFGVESFWYGNQIQIPHQSYKARPYTVEADWSGASYWYELAVLAHQASFGLKDLFQMSFQGDAAIAGIFQTLGIETQYKPSGVDIMKRENKCKFFTHDFIDNPDVVQTLVVTLCLKGIPFRITGAQSLRIKETDRIAALQHEMRKLGFQIEEPEPGVLSWDGSRFEADKIIRIETYDDHRMALAFAPAALYYPGLIIADAGVVSKSYPGFWEDLKSIGASLEEV